MELTQVVIGKYVYVIRYNIEHIKTENKDVEFKIRLCFNFLNKGVSRFSKIGSQWETVIKG